MTDYKALLQLTPEGGWIKPDNVRIKPLSNSELSPRKKFALRLMLKVGTARCPNLFRTMFHNLRVFRGFAWFNSRVMPKGKLPRRDTELMILRIGWKMRSYYEWGQHIDIGLRIGLSAEDIIRITRGPEAFGWTAYERLILQAVDELIDNRVVSPQTWKGLTEYLNNYLMIELLFAITAYTGLASVLNTVGVELEDEVQSAITGAATSS